MKHPDHYDTDAATSKRMANVKLKHGKAETYLAKLLWHKGFRYKLNYKKLPGSPDIAIQRYHIAVFVDGEFWHGKDWGTRRERLQRNRDYWIEKIEENMARDIRNNESLLQMGWYPVRFWEKDVLKNPDDCVDTILTIARQRQENDHE